MRKKRVLKIISNSLVLLSIIFLVVYLIKKEQIVWLEIKNVPIFIISIFCVLSGFLIESLALKFFLGKNLVKLELRQSIIATGIFIFSKYIPGKVGIILGKASYIADFKKVPVIEAFQKIFLFQIIILLCSFLISMLPLYAFLHTRIEHFILFIMGSVIFLGLLSHRRIRNYFLNLAGKMIKRKIDSPVSVSDILVTVLILITCFLLWSLGFYFLSVSLGFDLPFNVGFLFPLAAFIGVIILIAPGGLGVREGIIAAGLLFYDLPKDLAISLSAFSRIWFLIGELLIFIIAFLLSVKGSLIKTEREISI